MNTTQQLAIFKIDRDAEQSLEETLLFCGYADGKDEVMRYFQSLKKQVDVTMNYDLEGDYIVLPAIHFKVKRS